MDLRKSYEFFQPETVTEKIHIIGCGSVGSTIAENLARCGVKKFTLWDFDTVESHNVVNQMFVQEDIGRMKVEALRDILLKINPDIADTISLEPKGWQGKTLSGYVFLAVDNIDLRRKFVEKFMGSQFIKAVFDVRTGLTDAQHYAADWSNEEMKNAMLASMQFSHEEAASEAPVSACGGTLGVATTVRIVSAMAVNNFLNFVKGGDIKKFMLVDCFNFDVTAF